MKLIKTVLILTATWVWCYFLSKPIHLKDKSIPAPGLFFSPFTGFWKNGKEVSLNKTLNKMPVEGSVYFDERAVPHIQANSLQDAYFMQGYVHAIHRLWQMDFSTRAAEGRISEIIGDKALEFDKGKRRKGLAESARKSTEIWKQHKEAYALLEAYSQGVNYYIDHLDYKDYPIEYKLMSFQPEPWSPYRSSLFHKAMAEILCGRDQDVELTNAKILFGDDFKMLFPEIDELTDPVIPSNTKFELNPQNMIPFKSDVGMNYYPVLVDSTPAGLGSNNWALNRNKSSTGNPVLCNDPHLSLNLPSIWYEQQIIIPEYNVYGVCFAGIPGVIIGFNSDIAWGITNAGWDVVDWYRINWTDQDRTSYLLDGQVKKVDYRIEEIKINGKASVFDTIKLTHWGPIVFEDTSNIKYGLAMHWIIQDSFDLNELSTFIGLNKAKNYSQYRKAIQNFSYPAQNMAYADREGNIALTVQGAMPIKQDQQGRFIISGDSSKNSWKGFIEFDKSPNCLNPERGFISSANQRSTDLSYPNYYNNGDFRDYRGTMINRLLNNQKIWTIDELKKLQMNNYSLLAETALPHMFKNLDSTKLNSDQINYIQSLKIWDKNYDSTSVDAVKFEIWFQELYQLVWDEITTDTLKKYTSLPSEATTVRLMNSRSGSKYFDIVKTSELEKLTDIMLLSLDKAIQKYNDKKYKHWADYKSARIDHMARIPSFGIPYISTSGSKDIINASWKTWGPSWRMVVELTKDGPKAFGVYPGGQDGRPGTNHYMEMIEKWRTGDYYALQYLKNDEDFKSINLTSIQFKKK